MCIDEILEWATGPEAAGIERTQAAGHVLKNRHATDRIPGDVHVGSLAAVGECTVRLDLTPDDRYAG